MKETIGFLKVLSLEKLVLVMDLVIVRVQHSEIFFFNGLLIWEIKLVAKLYLGGFFIVYHHHMHHLFVPLGSVVWANVFPKNACKRKYFTVRDKALTMVALKA